MKTFHSLLAVSAITLVLGATAALRAGPPPSFWNHKPAAAPAPAPTTQCNPAVCTNCPSCGGCAAKPAPKANA